MTGKKTFGSSELFTFTAPQETSPATKKQTYCLWSKEAVKVCFIFGARMPSRNCGNYFTSALLEAHIRSSPGNMPVIRAIKLILTPWKTTQTSSFIIVSTFFRPKVRSSSSEHPLKHGESTNTYFYDLWRFHDVFVVIKP